MFMGKDLVRLNEEEIAGLAEEFSRQFHPARPVDIKKIEQTLRAFEFKEHSRLQYGVEIGGPNKQYDTNSDSDILLKKVMLNKEVNHIPTRAEKGYRKFEEKYLMGQENPEIVGRYARDVLREEIIASSKKGYKYSLNLEYEFFRASEKSGRLRVIRPVIIIPGADEAAIAKIKEFEMEFTVPTQREIVSWLGQNVLEEIRRKR